MKIEGDEDAIIALIFWIVVAISVPFFVFTFACLIAEFAGGYLSCFRLFSPY